MEIRRVQIARRSQRHSQAGATLSCFVGVRGPRKQLASALLT
jgi:hypothetical protein